MLMPSIFEENLFDNFFNEFREPVRKTFRALTPVSNVMKTDVKETDEGYELFIDLPGYKKEDIKAELKDGYMTVSAAGTVEKEEKNEDGKYIRRERYVGSCSRSFYVGEAVTEEDIMAKFEDGILKIDVPKKELQPKVEEKKYIPIAG